MKNRGFTLIEMMIVVAILGILGALIAPVISTINFNIGGDMLTAGEIGALLFVVVAAIIGISAMWRFRKMNKEFEARGQRLKAMEEEHQRRFSTPPRTTNSFTRSVVTPRKTQTQAVGNNSVGIQSGGDVRYTSPSLTDDLVTSMILNQVLHSHSGAVSAKVDYDSGSITMREEPTSYSSSSSSDESDSRKSSYSSSYSSSDDDSRSSYSSSYSSSSSDSSYSSSSSDSSYSSSSSD